MRDLRLRDLRQAVGIVFEDTFLFSDTIAANIAFADPDAPTPRSNERPGSRGRTSSSATWATATPPASVSGATRCRAGSGSGSPSRAILADPQVLILDDATSAVDPTKEHEIRDALTSVMRGRTTIVIAHRPATIALADRVVLVDSGRVAAEGTHESLLAPTTATARSAAAAARESAAWQRVRTATARGSPARGGLALMWMASGVSDEDKLDRAAARRVLRRTARMLRPQARRVAGRWR